MPINYHSVGNAIESILWLLLAVMLFVAGLRNPTNRTRYWSIAAVLIVFGISDVVEIQTGAWWRPWWLLAWKGACIALFVLLCWKWPKRPEQCRPIVIAEVTFLPTADGGRQTPPELTQDYMPHLVVQPIHIRHALTGDGGVGREPYLGICFLEAPRDYRFGETVRVKMELTYHPQVNYDALKPDSDFTIREGGSVIGFGRVVDRIPPWS